MLVRCAELFNQLDSCLRGNDEFSVSCDEVPLRDVHVKYHEKKRWRASDGMPIPVEYARCRSSQ